MGKAVNKKALASQVKTLASTTFNEQQMTDVMLSSVPRWVLRSLGTTNALVDGTAAYQTPRPRSSGLVPTDGLAPTDGGGKRSAAGGAAGAGPRRSLALRSQRWRDRSFEGRVTMSADGPGERPRAATRDGRSVPYGHD